MSTKRYLAAAAGLAGIGAFAWRWRRNYLRRRDDIATDVIDGTDLTYDEIAEFDAIADFTCLDPCCFRFYDGDSDVISRYWGWRLSDPDDKY